MTRDCNFLIVTVMVVVRHVLFTAPFFRQSEPRADEGQSPANVACIAVAAVAVASTCVKQLAFYCLCVCLLFGGFDCCVLYLAWPWTSVVPAFYGRDSHGADPENLYSVALSMHNPLTDHFKHESHG